MAKVFWKGSTLLAPVPPTMVSCGTMEKPNIITVAWTGIVNSQPPMTYISVRPSRYSYELIKQSGEFVINLTPASLVRQADWCGVKSGREVDKFEACKLTPLAANQVSAPLIAECPINLECRVRTVTPLGSHDMFLADIVGVNVDEQYLDEKMSTSSTWTKMASSAWTSATLPAICTGNILRRAKSWAPLATAFARKRSAVRAPAKKNRKKNNFFCKKVLTTAQSNVIITLVIRGYGGIGRRARFRYRFKSCYPHHKKKASTVRLELFFLS